MGQTSTSDLSQKRPFEEDCQYRFAAHKRTKKRKVNLRSELDHYLEEDVMPDIKNFDILDFWKKDFKYPILRMIGRDLLAISVSTMALLKVHLAWEDGWLVHIAQDCTPKLLKC